MRFLSPLRLAWTAAYAARSLAYDVDINDRDSIIGGTVIAVDGMMNYYSGHLPGQIPGNLPPPYYWWEVGAMFGALMDYWWYTGNDTWNDIVIQGMLHQIGDDGMIMPKNQTTTEGNDDQAFWAIATMTATERGFPNPPDDKPQWLAVTQTVFNLQTTRWDMQNCNGGLRWQIFTWNNGYNYKNTVSNGCLFQLAARLGRYTGNTTYNEWADKIWDWSVESGLISEDYRFFDGLDIGSNCSINHNQWSYNAGLYLAGSAFMYNITTGAEQEKWKKRVDGILWMAGVFFHPEQTDIMYEAICEPYPRGCNTDQKSFKAYFSRWLAITTQMAPYTAEIIMPKLRTSAIAALKTCVGGYDGITCGLKWYQGDWGAWDGNYGVGEQMAVLEVTQSNLIPGMAAPFTQDFGGNSTGDPAAGGGGDNPQLNAIVDLHPPSAGQKAGAAFATLVVLSMTGYMAYYMVS
ncbi:hypothetical protein ABW19_dt0203363 [Dactylella cylindrospora]|nr:hypothetical protein ABW19_dt0203363 [Dactylella cylindrospora]